VCPTVQPRSGPTALPSGCHKCYLHADKPRATRLANQVEDPMKKIAALIAIVACLGIGGTPPEPRPNPGNHWCC
jgi:hypothetical protein